MSFTFSPMIDEELGNTPRNANMILAAIRQNNALGRVLKVEPNYILIGVPNLLQLSLAKRTLSSMGFAQTEYDREFNRRTDMFCLRRGEMTVIVKNENFSIGQMGQIGAIGAWTDYVPGSGLLKGGNQSLEDISSAPGKLANIAVTAADALATNLTLAEKAALETATFGFDMGVKTVLGFAIIYAVATLLPKLIDAGASSYDRVAESRNRAREFRLIKDKQEMEHATTVSKSTGSVLGV
jgi:hypothetical protein